MLQPFVETNHTMLKSCPKLKFFDLIPRHSTRVDCKGYVVIEPETADCMSVELVDRFFVDSSGRAEDSQLTSL